MYLTDLSDRFCRWVIRQIVSDYGFTQTANEKAVIKVALRRLPQVDVSIGEYALAWSDMIGR